MSLVSELKRRNVFRVALAYLAVAWLLIQVAETTLPLFGVPDSIVRLIVILLIIGIIPAAIFAWVFELTPEGLKLESEVDRSKSITAQTGKQLDRILIAVLALALVYFAVDKFVLSDMRIEYARQEGRSQGLLESYGDKSIAVLPFVDMSSAGDQEYMSDGIAEELLNLLTRIPELRVISRSSSFAYKGKDINIPTIAEDLNVAFVLEGSVRKAGDRIRITAQLVEGRSDTHIWSETFERELDDIFAIQDEISAAVVGELELVLMDEPLKVRKTSPDAYALFLQARFLHEDPTSRNLRQALDTYKAALEIDDQYVPGWVWLAALYDDMANSLGIPYEEVGRLARGAIGRALAIEPDNPMALGMSAIIISAWDHDLGLASAQMQRALQLDESNPILLRWAALMMPYFDQYDDAVRVNEYLVERDPVGRISLINLGISYVYAGQPDDAIRISEVLLADQPDSGIVRYTIGLAYLQKGDDEQVLHYIGDRGGSARLAAIEAIAVYGLDRRQEFVDILGEMRARFEAGESTIANYMALVHASTGNVDEAFTWLERARDEGVFGLAPTDIRYAALHDDPRWTAMMAESGLSEEKLAAMRIEVNLPL